MAPTPQNLAPAVPRLTPTFSFGERDGDNFFRPRANPETRGIAIDLVAEVVLSISLALSCYSRPQWASGAHVMAWCLWVPP